ncbi:hypothetical protein [Candidatus Endomicrobiellum agilis]|uniref:hypothetical protein n=1 Tax=Candidatus Endomicrobiellum agilis TaxID=3238957 RepID=UPI00358C8CD5|nr:hypothetical protein [Endomicrobium sp.]
MDRIDRDKAESDKAESDKAESDKDLHVVLNKTKITRAEIDLLIAQSQKMT